MRLKETDVSEWRKSLGAYSAQVSARENVKLEALEQFYWSELPARIAGRGSSPFITQDELKRVVEWKLTRGKWRPRLLGFASSLADDDVISASRKAFAAMPDLKVAITELSALKGVGPATASAVLAAYDPQAPFMSDEALEAATGSRLYTLKHYLEFARLLQAKAKELNSELGKVGDDGKEFTASDIERALWASLAEIKLPRKSAAKRKSSTQEADQKNEATTGATSARKGSKSRRT